MSVLENSSTNRALVGASPSSGTAYVVAFILMANANAVFSGRLLQSLHPFTFLFWGFFATSIVFMARLIFTTGAGALTIKRADAGALFTLNAMTALSWIGYFIALRYIEPAIVTAIVCGFGPPSVIALERVVRQRKLPSHAYVAAAGTLLGTEVLVWASMAGLSGIKTTNPYESLVGLIAAIVGGISQAMSVIATKQLGDKGWNSTRIMSHRFHLLIPIAAILAISGPGLSVASFDQLNHLVIDMIFGVALPLWLLQRGILLSTPFVVSVLLSLGPVLTYLVQGFDDRIAWSIPSALGCLVVVLFTIYGTVVKSNSVRARP